MRRSFALIRKDGGTRCLGPQGVLIDCDKLIHRTTFDVYDTVINAGAAHNKVGWLHEGRHPDLADRLVEPVEYTVGTGGGGGGPQPVCRFAAMDLSEVHAHLATIGDRLDRIEDATVAAEAAAIQAREMVQALMTVLHDNGLQLEASARLSGRITGTAKLPKG